MLDRYEKIYLVVLVISTIILIFTVLYFTNKCPETYSPKSSKKPERPLIVYKINNKTI